MKKLALCFVFILGSCGGINSVFDNAELPVVEISNRSAEIIKVLGNADLDKDGKISGFSEWSALGTGAVQLFIEWATKINTQE